MGGIGSKNRLTGLANGVDADVFGAAGGLESTVIAQASLPNVNFVIAAGQGSHTHALLNGNAIISSSVGGGSVATTGSNDSNTSLANATLPQMSAASGGSGTAINNVQPTIITNFLVVVE